MLAVKDARVSFGDVAALDGVDLQVESGEIVAVLGPSGCGKSTLLRAVAGLQPLDAGEIRWDGEDLAAQPVHRRDFGLMFQEHALFAHRDVSANVAFGLRMKRLDAEARDRRVEEVLDLVGLAGYRRRAITTLSGGEAQRVALARSLAPEPRLLMLDEPLGSLDRPRREQLTAELRTLLRRVGVTALHVSHDHDEAFAVADRVALMQSGRIVRIGAPAEVWRDPRLAATARFLGHTNIVSVGGRGEVPWGRLSVAAGRAVIRSDAFTRLADSEPSSAPAPGSGWSTGSGSEMGMEIGSESSAAASGSADLVTATVSDVRFRGDRFELHLRTEPGAFQLVAMDAQPARVGQRLSYRLDPDRIARLAD
ncbi:MAG: ABC transporter ATP-binding protein [Acidimicrobiaceae bacterium]|nr:ABC transporter ATP-binding protein [Acidimicrobiaceae bacterium]MCY4176686.1 ABC transporter ATP-binding protein [Acidimicrobiaceae bacterium]MCY4281235.1 ABC transporter ATP-binding protein [Acidimicrobiaceae bacterium]